MAVTALTLCFALLGQLREIDGRVDVHILPPYCTLPAETGHCRAAIRNYFYNYSSRECEQFIYGGCGGNKNRFDKRIQCNHNCRDVDYGVCFSENAKTQCNHKDEAPKGYFWFNVENRTCEKYQPSECRHGENIFPSRRKCYEACKPFIRNPCDMPILTPKNKYCDLGITEKRYGFDANTNKCKRFLWSPCYHNANSFISRKRCLESCAPSSPCLLAARSYWTGMRRSYYYDPDKDECREAFRLRRPKVLWPFRNAFLDRQTCEKECAPLMRSPL